MIATTNEPSDEQPDGPLGAPTVGLDLEAAAGAVRPVDPLHD